MMPSYRPGAKVGVETSGEVVYLAHLPDGPVVILEGTAALIWTEACASGEGDIAGRVALQVGRASAEIAHHVEAFIGDLVERRLLEPIG